MLSPILSKDFCSTCKYCCVYDSSDFWEIPESIRNDFDEKIDWVAEGEVVCPHLDARSGCRLSAKEKPFECAIWPFRIMTKENRIIMAVAKTCKGMQAHSMEELRQFAYENLREPANAYLKAHPQVVKPFADYYTELFGLTERLF